MWPHKPRILFLSAMPMNYSMFRPIHKRIKQVSDTDVFIAPTDKKRIQDYLNLGLSEKEIISYPLANLAMWDAVIEADFISPDWWEHFRIQIFHGVAAKATATEKDYRYHSSLPRYDAVFFANRDDCEQALRLNLLKNAEAGAVVGMAALDEVLHNSKVEYRISLKEKLLPPRWQNSHVILYAPTWGDASSFTRQAKETLQALAATHSFIIVKPHPRCLLGNVADTGLSLASYLKELFPDGNYLLRTGIPYEIMPIADMIVSDFSSIIFEFALLKKSMYLFEAKNHGEKVADKKQYEMLRACCRVFREGEPVVFETAAPSSELLLAMDEMCGKYFANPGKATDKAVEELVKRSIIKLNTAQ